MIKHIYAIVSEKDFHQFRHRCYSENMKMGEALSALVHAYAKGNTIKEIQKTNNTGISLKELGGIRK